MSEPEEFRPKHTISDSVRFQKDREKLGGLILEGMKTTGGTDIDWIVEHNGGFIIMENKGFSNDHISIPVGQMIAFERLHEKLNSDGKCHFLIFGYDDIDFKNPESTIWFFDMKDWKTKSIPFTKNTQYNKRYIVERKVMTPITLKEYREMMEKFWKEFEKN